jgi:hypothetical protein
MDPIAPESGGSDRTFNSDCRAEPCSAGTASLAVQIDEALRIAEDPRVCPRTVLEGRARSIALRDSHILRTSWQERIDSRSSDKQYRVA